MKREATNGSAMIKRRWSALLESLYVAIARRRFASQIAFVRARLSPRVTLVRKYAIGVCLSS
jgi:hypothetical protein